jgi:hypothetical protein
MKSKFVPLLGAFLFSLPFLLISNDAYSIASCTSGPCGDGSSCSASGNNVKCHCGGDGDPGPAFCDTWNESPLVTVEIIKDLLKQTVKPLESKKE